MENKVNTLTKNLQELGYIVTVFDKIESASEYLNSKIDGTSVGFAGSMTLEKSGLYDMLKTHNEVYWHHRIPEGKTSKDVRMQARDTKVYLTSVNAISLAGEIVNIDANCNRVAEIFYGHEKVYFIIGTNKIEDDYDKALYRGLQALRLLLPYRPSFCSKLCLRYNRFCLPLCFYQRLA